MFLKKRTKDYWSKEKTEYQGLSLARNWPNVAHRGTQEIRISVSEDTRWFGHPHILVACMNSRLCILCDISRTASVTNSNSSLQSFITFNSRFLTPSLVWSQLCPTKKRRTSKGFSYLRLHSQNLSIYETKASTKFESVLYSSCLSPTPQKIVGTVVF